MLFWGTHVCVFMNVEAIGQHWASNSIPFHLVFFRQGLLMSLGFINLTRLAIQQNPMTLLSLPVRARIIGILFYINDGAGFQTQILKFAQQALHRLRHLSHPVLYKNG